ncbi:GumC family protein [Vibrio agarivorans]|uniref:GumC family protein n=1 Tax=Vibrio agarivorans TaxID=153622 RepID=UPI002231372C|nr:polysaccharide biosynthesis tyrosine autokinase [Vibrio agarivorans]
MESKQNTFTIEPTVIDVSRYFTALKRRMLLIVLIVAALSSATYLVTRQMSPVYSATTTLLIESKPKSAISIEEIVGVDASKQEYYQTQYEIMRSNQVAERVINQFQLDFNPEFNGELQTFSIKNTIFGYLYVLRNRLLGSPETSDVYPGLAQNEEQRRRVLNTFKSKLSVSPVRQTQLVNITFESYNPSTAATLANAVAQAYIENNIEARIIVSQQAEVWIDSKLKELSANLSLSERRLAEFLEGEGLVDVEGVDALQSRVLTDVTSQISVARDRRLAAESLYRVLQDNRNADISTLYAIPDISKHPQIRDVRVAEIELQQKRSELSKRYGPKHDKMVQVNAELTSIQGQAHQLLRQLASGIEKEYRAAKRQEEALKAELEDMKSQFNAVSIKQTEYSKYQRDVENNRRILDLFENRKKETSATSDYQPAIARITDPALYPVKPSKPNRLKIVLAVAVVSFALLCTLVIIREFLRNELEQASDVERKLGFSPIASIPRIKRRWFAAKPSVTQFNNSDNPSFSEAIRSLRTRLLLSVSNKNRTCFALTSPNPNEGKSTIAANLALSLTKVEKVIIVDADLRKPTLGSLFNLSLSDNGLSNYLLMDTPLQECLHHDEDSGITVLPSGFIPPNPQEMLSSEKFKRLIEHLKQQYDRVIIDCPPVMVVSDALLIGHLSEAMLLVLKANTTKTHQAKNAIAELINHQVKIDGVVLNYCNEERLSNAQSYYKSYSYKATPAE